MELLRDAPTTATALQVPSDFGGRAGPGVLPNPYGPGLLMFYTAIAEEEVGVYGKWSIGCATSEDGISWTRVGDKPVIEGGASCLSRQQCFVLLVVDIAEQSVMEHQQTGCITR